MRNLKINIMGFALCDQIERAKRMLKNLKEGTCLITCINGAELYIKEKGKVRLSTQKEWNDYFDKKKVK